MPDLSVFGKFRTKEDYDRAAAEFDLKKQLAAKELAGGNDPAAIQIANEIAKARASGDQQRINDLYQIGKYGEKGWVVGQDGSISMQEGSLPAIYDAAAAKSAGAGQYKPQVVTTPDGQSVLTSQTQSLGGYGAPPNLSEITLDRAMNKSPASVNIPKQTLPPTPNAGGMQGIPQQGNPAAMPQRSYVDNLGGIAIQSPEQEAEASARGGAYGKEQGTAKGELASFSSSLPNLIRTTNKLAALSDLATYTIAGQARDKLIKEVGFDPGNSATARTEFMTTIDNEVLPMLRQTFGAAFTQKEGESLKATLGDPNLSPSQKRAALRAKLESYAGLIQSKQRQLGLPVEDFASLFQGSTMTGLRDETGVNNVPPSAYQKAEKEFNNRKGAIKVKSEAEALALPAGTRFNLNGRTGIAQ